MNILLNGALGNMGREVVKLPEISSHGFKIAVGIDTSYNGEKSVIPMCRSFDEINTTEYIDCIIDFSHHSGIRQLADFAKENKIPTVIATTGHTESELSEIHSLSKCVPVFFSANMSLGVALLVELAKTAVLAMPEAEIEIIEKHHDKKIDAPSGTAFMIADALCGVRPDAYIKPGRCGQGMRKREEIGIHAIRMGNAVGEHEVIVGTENQTITLKHEAHSRTLFAEGAIAAAKFIIGKQSGLYSMKSLVSGERGE